jgi:hypothetical protein
MSLMVVLRSEDYLRYSIPVPQIDEDHAPKIASYVYPAG